MSSLIDAELQEAHDLLPLEALEEVVRVLGYGATEAPQPDGTKGYGDWNWLKGMSWSRLLRSGMGHVFKWAMGQKLDPDSKTHPLANAICCFMFLLVYEQRGLGKDDRVLR
jgi:hypothetical protein